MPLLCAAARKRQKREERKAAEEAAAAAAAAGMPEPQEQQQQEEEPAAAADVNCQACSSDAAAGAASDNVSTADTAATATTTAEESEESEGMDAEEVAQYEAAKWEYSGEGPVPPALLFQQQVSRGSAGRDVQLAPVRTAVRGPLLLKAGAVLIVVLHLLSLAVASHCLAAQQLRQHLRC